MDWLAKQSAHLTPKLLESELNKLKQPARLIAVHIKPAYQQQVEQELRAMSDHEIESARLGHTYRF